VKFTPAGEVAIKASVTEQADGAVTVRFEVRDTGIGIEPGNHERLFESFSQADASTTRKFGGTGLGLAICQRLTEAMDGEIGLSSELGQGSTFWFSIRLPISDHGTAAPVPAADLLAGLKVLVVDDNATNRLVLESQLSGWKMQPDSVEGGSQALGRLHAMAAAGEPYQIAVLDMCMPKMDGVELARHIRRDETLRDLRIIMLTSTMQVNRTELLDAGVQEWLTKPVRNSEFFDRLMRLMASSSGAMRVPERPAAAKKEAPDAYRGRILVVEDNEVNQLVARSMVARLGFDVDLVTDGSQAVLAAAPGAYAAVLMDCHMPVMDGFEATRAIRTRQGNGSLPVIAMTAGALDEDRERCFAAGMDDYLTKPLDLARLQEVLDRWIPPTPVQESSPPQEATPNDQPSIDPVRLAVLRELGPADGRGLLPAAAEAFREGLRPSLQAIREALDDGGGALRSAAHKLQGAAANIGASRAAELCRELERLDGNREAEGPALVDQLEAELALVDRYLKQTLSEVS
jgi:CheY-like chemotaxis protein/HPt (histidine-containing phosphotransfer) domain-containing protein